ncbi:MAG: menaquinone biosynthesis decarboxylase [Alistipes sp.]|jgi:4-hydroxy-3-polyprenylbenzoate decarboxylase|nr:menaquinone biosynthesis decarboxylase [Alistipes sp.]
MYKNLNTYIGLLEREGELVRVAAQVSPVLEIAEITDRVSKSPGGGGVLLFERVEGSVFPVVTNLFGSERRIALALGAGSLDEISGRLDGLLREAFAPRGSLAEKIKAVPLLAEASRWFPRQVSGRGECQQVVLRGSEARLSALPVLKCWPHDGGRFVTLPLVHTVGPNGGAQNVGMYRMQVYDDHTTGMHWHIHKTGARHYEAYRRAGVARMPVSVCLGGDPAYTYAATAPMPDGMDEYLLAGFLRRRPVRLVRCVTNDLWVPADCDFVIEGWVDVNEPLRTEGPFGDHTGFYSLEDPYPVFHVSAITYRRDAIYPATLVGVPPQEDAWFAAATEKVFLPPIRSVLQPEICDMHMPPAGCAHNLAIVSLDISYAGQAEKVAAGLWGAGQMMFNKVLIATPADFPIRDPEKVLELLRGIDPERDLVFGHGVLDVLDHATATPGVGGKLLIDATRPRGNAAGDNFKLIFDPAAEGMPPYECLWLGIANIDPVRDITIKDGIATVDGRAKTSEGNGMPSRWPNVVVMDETTVVLVDRRWAEYGLGDFLPSPSDRYRKLLLSEVAQVSKKRSE